jgi:glycosyltransferase involved in cell wall biosynthesis
MENSFRIITPVYNAAAWIAKCIESVKEQTFSNFHQVIIDDTSTDDTVLAAEAAIGDDPRFTLLKNSERRGTVYNHRKGVEFFKREGEDIVVHLDGDDWFYDKNVLDKVNKIYNDTGCWLTYGSYESTMGAPCVAREYTEPPRKAVIDGWPFSHLRTFKRFLWDTLEDHHFKDSEGEYYRAAADVVIFVPILEKIGYDNVKFIKDPLVIYNTSTPNNEHKTMLQEQVKVALDVIQR